MAWIESHTVLRNHRKVLLLSRALRLNTAQTIGHLHLLWHAALEQQENGDLSKWTDELIAELAGFTGDAPQFVRLLQKFGWLDGKMIHDWWEYAGRYLQSKYGKSPEKWQTIKRGLTDYQQTTSRLPSIPNQPNLTYLTNLLFEQIWGLYPRKLGKEKAFKQLKKTILTENDFNNCIKATKNYCESVKGKDIEYIKHGSTFFNGDWPDWVDYKEKSNGTGKGFSKQSFRGDNTAGTEPPDKYTKAGIPD